MVKKILIANRGEIACRIIKTAKKMGISTVSVFSDADKNSRHVRLADEAIHLGPSESVNSYLSFDKILEAINTSKADAVHPGYGFLSENADFAEILEKNNITFIGPPSSAIKKMGDKIESKKIAINANVSTVPGYAGQIKSPKEAEGIAKEIGFPLMIKASAGGGGKGMRIINDFSEIEESFLIATNEAKKSFNDSRVFLEKYISNPHHIEIQILGDKFGNYIFFGERECSIQRRNQKVIEEAPSPFISEKTRILMGAQAISLAREVNYHSAGTVEFIVDENENFYFLEMNTRLQVEHPVTELVYNVDLVKKMIEISCGKKLDILQSEVKSKGHAVESRIYAEDPFKSFLPSTGRLTRYKPPLESQTEDEIIRNDTGVYEGGEISIYYDPMISKLCTWGKSRSLAIHSMKKALDNFEIEGINHNIPFLSAVFDNLEFGSGNYTTAFIEKNYPNGFKWIFAERNLKTLMKAFAASLYLILEERKVISFDKEKSNKLFQKKLTIIDYKDKNQVIISKNKKIFKFRILGGNSIEFETDWKPGKSLAMMKVNNEKKYFKIKIDCLNFSIYFREFKLDMTILETRLADLYDYMISNSEEQSLKDVNCPMPGLLVSFFVNEGDLVQEGDSLCIVEAMKMENIIKSERKGKIKKINVVEGETLSVNQVILEFE